MILHFLSPLTKGKCVLAGHRIHQAVAKMSVTSYPGVQVTLKDGLRIIRLDKPRKKNALSLDVTSISMLIIIVLLLAQIWNLTTQDAYFKAQIKIF